MMQPLMERFASNNTTKYDPPPSGVSSCASRDGRAMKNVYLISKDGSIAQHCMNCGIGMHGALCSALWGDIKCDSNIIICRLSQRGLGNAGSETAVICSVRKPAGY